MTTLPEFGPGAIRLLWRSGSHDGFAAGVAMLESFQQLPRDEFGTPALEEGLESRSGPRRPVLQPSELTRGALEDGSRLPSSSSDDLPKDQVIWGTPVYLDMVDPGYERLQPEWQLLEDLLEKLCSNDDFENIWDRLERSYRAEMHHRVDRKFNVHELPSREFDQLLEEHRLWQLHVGLSSDYWYDGAGPPRIWPRQQWAGSEYVQAHYYEVVPWRERQNRLLGYPVIGTVTRTALWAPSALRSPAPTDPRPDALKAYQATWKPGDPVREGW